MAQHLERPGRPRVLSISATSADLSWTAPEQPPAGYCVSAQIGGSGEWSVLIADTHSDEGRVIVQGLIPETWYTFRVATIDEESGGTGFGSAPSKPAKTARLDRFAVQVKPTALPVRPTGGAPVSVGRTAAAAAIVARGVETAAPLTEEETSSASRAASDAFEAARLRKELCEYEVDFEALAGRPPTQAEREASVPRSELLRRYVHLERSRLQLGDDLSLELTPLGAHAAVRTVTGAQPTAASLTAPGAGGAMALEKRILATRLNNEARNLYARPASPAPPSFAAAVPSACCSPRLALGPLLNPFAQVCPDAHEPLHVAVRGGRALGAQWSAARRRHPPFCRIRCQPGGLARAE